MSDDQRAASGLAFVRELHDGEALAGARTSIDTPSASALDAAPVEPRPA